jgi:hypothetical protein
MTIIPKDFKVSAGINVGGPVSPQVTKAAQLLNELPFKLLLSSREVASRLEISVPRFQSSVGILLTDCRVKVGCQFLYGSKKTIAELLKRQKEQADAEEN